MLSGWVYNFIECCRSDKTCQKRKREISNKCVQRNIKKLKTCLGLPSVDAISELIKTENKVNLGENQNKLKIDIPILRPQKWKIMKNWKFKSITTI